MMGYCETGGMHGDGAPTMKLAVRSSEIFTALRERTRLNGRLCQMRLSLAEMESGSCPTLSVRSHYAKGTLLVLPSISEVINIGVVTKRGAHWSRWLKSGSQRKPIPRHRQNSLFSRAFFHCPRSQRRKDRRLCPSEELTGSTLYEVGHFQCLSNSFSEFNLGRANSSLTKLHCPQ